MMVLTYVYGNIGMAMLLPEDPGAGCALCSVHGHWDTVLI